MGGEVTSTRLDDRTNQRLWLLVGPVVISSGLLLTTAFLTLSVTRQHVAAGSLFAILLMIAQVLRVHLRVGGNHLRLSPMSAVALIMTTFLPGAWALVSTAAGMIAVTIIDRQQPIKIGFNAGKEILAVGAAVTASAMVGAQPEFGGVSEDLTTRILGLTAAAIGYGLVDELLSVSLFSIITNTPVRRLILIHIDANLLSRLVSLLIVLLSIWAYSIRPYLVVGLPFLVYALHLASANQLRSRTERRAWQRLAQATDELNTVDVEQVITTALRHACDLFSADEVDLEIRIPSSPIRLIRGTHSSVIFDGPLEQAPVATGYVIPSVPGHGNDDDLGRLRLRFQGPVRFSDRELYTLRTFATALNTAIRNAATFAETRRLAERHEKAAHEDPLTLLANRLRLQSCAGHLLEDQPERRDLALLIIDLNHFKEVNETLGHSAGDRLLVEVAKRLSRAARQTDLVARLGGDEFAVLFTALSEQADPIALATTVLSVLDAPIDLDGMSIGIEASAGIAISLGMNGGVHELLRRADVAMYQAKRTGQGLVSYSTSGDTACVGALSLGGDLAQAINDQEFILDFQPIVDLGSGQVIAAEALARWKHPHRGVLRPDQFLDGVERSGQLAAFAATILDQALVAVKEWHAAGFPLDIAVNVSPRSLLDPTFPSGMTQALADHDVSAEVLIVELTESLILSRNPMVDEILDALRAAGIRLALDDFGTGFSSLSTVTRVPIYELKIDRSFVSAMDSPAAKAVVRSTIELGRHLDALVVAEGVETEDQRRRLWELGCPAGQGYLFARPMASDRFLARLRRGTAGHGERWPPRSRVRGPSFA